MTLKWEMIEQLPEFQNAPVEKQRRAKDVYSKFYMKDAPDPERRNFVTGGLGALQQGVDDRSLLEKAADKLSGLLGFEEPLRRSQSDEGAKARATVELQAKEEGIPVSEYREGPRLLEQFAGGMTNAMGLGLPNAVRRAVLGENMNFAPSSSGEQIAGGLGELAGFIGGAAGGVTGAVGQQIASRLPQASSLAGRAAGGIMAQAPALGAGFATRQVGEAIQEKSLADAAESMGKGTAEGVITGTIFGGAGAIPNRIARIATGLVALEAQKQTGPNSGIFDDRPISEKAYDIAQNIYFLWKGHGPKVLNRMEAEMNKPEAERKSAQEILQIGFEPQEVKQAEPKAAPQEPQAPRQIEAPVEQKPDQSSLWAYEDEASLVDKLPDSERELDGQAPIWLDYVRARFENNRTAPDATTPRGQGAEIQEQGLRWRDREVDPGMDTETPAESWVDKLRARVNVRTAPESTIPRGEGAAEQEQAGRWAEREIEPLPDDSPGWADKELSNVKPETASPESAIEKQPWEMTPVEWDAIARKDIISSLEMDVKDLKREQNIKAYSRKKEELDSIKRGDPNQRTAAAMNSYAKNIERAILIKANINAHAMDWYASLGENSSSGIVQRGVPSGYKKTGDVYVFDKEAIAEPEVLAEHPDLAPKEEDAPEPAKAEPPAPQSKKEKSLAEYNAYVASLDDAQRKQAGDLIKDNPWSPGLAKRAIEKVLAGKATTVPEVKAEAQKSEPKPGPKPQPEPAKPNIEDLRPLADSLKKAQDEMQDYPDAEMDAATDFFGIDPKKHNSAQEVSDRLKEYGIERKNAFKEIVKRFYPDEEISPKQDATKDDGIGFTASKDDIPYELAKRAHSGTSWVPEERASQVQGEYYGRVMALYEKHKDKAETPEQKAAFIDAMNRYKDGYIKHQKSVLEAKSRTMSTMVTGGSNFPTRRNEKRMDTEMKRMKEFIEWEKTASKAVADSIEKTKNADQKKSDFLAKAKKAIDYELSFIKRIDDGKAQGFDRDAFKNSLIGKLKTIARHDPEAARQALEYLDKRQADLFESPPITKKHSIWKIAEPKETPLEYQKDQQEKAKKKGGGTTLYSGIPIHEAWDLLKKFTDKFYVGVKEQDATLYRQLAGLPSWTAKKYPKEFGPLFDIVNERQLNKTIIRNGYLKDLLPAWKDLTAEETKKVGDILWRGDKLGKVLNESGMAKLSPAARRAYEATREVLDYIWKEDRIMTYRELFPEESESEIQEMRNLAGEVTGYMPHDRKGKWFISAKNRAGEKLWNQHFDDITRTMTRGNYGVKTKMIEKKIREMFPDASDIFHGKVTRVFAEDGYFDVSPQITEELINAAMKRVKGEDISKEDFDQALKKAVAEVFMARGFMSHGIQRSGVEGFDKSNWQQSVLDYVSGWAGYKSKMIAAQKVSKKWGGIDWTGKEGLRQYADKYVRDAFRNDDNMDRLSAKVRSALFFKFLGGVVKSAVVNLTQTPVAFWSRISVETKWSSAKIAEESARMAADIVKAFYTEPKNGESRRETAQAARLSPGLLRGITKARQDGTIGDQLTQELMADLPGKYGSVVRGAGEIMKWMFGQAEIFNREVAYAISYKVGEERGYTFEKADKFARDMIRESHFQYGKFNLPPFARGQGKAPKLARAAYTFRSYSHNMIEMYMSLATDHSTAGKLAILKSLGAIALIGGIGSLPFFETIEEEYHRLTGKNIRSEIKKKWGEWATYINYGVPGLFGVDLSTSLGQDVPKSAIEILGAPTAFWQETSNMVDDIKKGDTYRAIEDAPVMPSAIRNVMKANRLGDRGLETRGGKPILDSDFEPVKLNKAEQVGQAMGFQPARVSEEYRQNRAQQVERDMWDKKKRLLGGRYRIADKKGNTDKILDEISEFNEKRPDYIAPVTVETIRQWIIDKPSKREVLMEEGIQ